MIVRLVQGQETSAPVCLSEAKIFLRVLGDDEDELIQALLDSAVEHCETILNKSVAIRLYCASVSSFDDPVLLPKTPFNSILKIEYKDENESIQRLGANEYEVEINEEEACVSFVNPPKGSNVNVYFRVGYQSRACPNNIKMAIRLLVSDWYDNRTNGVSEKKTAVDRLLSPLRKQNF